MMMTLVMMMMKMTCTMIIIMMMIIMMMAESMYGHDEVVTNDITVVDRYNVHTSIMS